MTADLAPAASATSGTSVPATRVKSSASTTSQFGYPRGHLGHLSGHEAEALDKFKNVLEERGAWKREPASHDDQTLLRYLRARRWVVEDAYKQFKDTEDWRSANHIDTLYRTIELDAYEQSRRLYPQWTGRRDRRGIPLYVFEIKNLDSKTVSEYERLGAKSTFSDAQTDGKTTPGLLRLFALYENLTRFSQPFCTQLTDREFPDVPITMSTNIVDVSGVGLKQFWNLKGHMQAASQLATAHYPETLDRIFIIGAPFFFSTVWGWIKRWFDPITVSKIFVLSPHEVKPTLEAFIEPRNIPKKYGGELDFSFGQLSVPDPSWEGVVAWENGYSSFPSGPLLWEDVDDGKRAACVALGKDKGAARNVRICTVPKTWPAEEDAQTQTDGQGEGAGVTAEGTQTNGEVSEGTQTADETRDDGAQTEEADGITNGEIVEKLKLTEDKTAAAQVEVAPAAAA
ncbi:CRAL/TRIO domain protein [Metarhizium robertsii]|uniref:Cellular retinaldehyde-binding/triple function n=2 Tax=Metarhizium robertsii TaxID=568076 RepID=E9EXP2_METRA|nr:Cellular retinaldehyde-binding/triple function [Metarhizium robertsii ARSEF 23]EFY99862.1 Cellular retinaldehyde-binding/triple function [Metarhizium robertsii ARSEF 23]EXV06555.1 CRAL/TRIO domain protein [Metarhizium robertsii]